jgi:hypothetical protein
METTGRYLAETYNQRLEVPIHEGAAELYRAYLLSGEYEPFVDMTFDDLIGRANDPAYDCSLRRFSEVGAESAYGPHLSLLFKDESNQRLISERTSMLIHERNAFSLGKPITSDEKAMIANNVRTDMARQAINRLRDTFEPDVQRALNKEIYDRIVDGAKNLRDTDYETLIYTLPNLRGKNVEQVWDLAKALYEAAKTSSGQETNERLRTAFAVVGITDERPMKLPIGRNKILVNMQRMK